MLHSVYGREFQFVVELFLQLIVQLVFKLFLQQLFLQLFIEFVVEQLQQLFIEFVLQLVFFEQFQLLVQQFEFVFWRFDRGAVQCLQLAEVHA